MKQLDRGAIINADNMQYDHSHVPFRADYPFRIYSTGEFVVYQQPRIDDRVFYKDYDIEIVASTDPRGYKFQTPEGVDVVLAWLRNLPLQTLLIDHTHKIAVASESKWHGSDKPFHLSHYGAYYSNVFNGQPKPVGSNLVAFSPPMKPSKEDTEWRRAVVEAATALDKLEDEYVYGWQHKSNTFNPLTHAYDIRTDMMKKDRPDPLVYAGSLDRYQIACIAQKGLAKMRNEMEVPYLIVK